MSILTTSSLTLGRNQTSAAGDKNAPLQIETDLDQSDPVGGITDEESLEGLQ